MLILLFLTTSFNPRWNHQILFNPELTDGANLHLILANFNPKTNQSNWLFGIVLGIVQSNRARF
jgi:hypothetical protein